MLRMAVVDDEHTVAAQTERCLTEACNELQLKAEINVFDSGEEVIRFLESENLYHIIFLDIEMERCNGIDVSRHIRDMLRDETTQLVYVSGKSGYDRQLFEFRPFGFIEKPATTEKIREILSKYKRIYGVRQDMFEYKVGHGTFFVELSEILYFESFGRKIRLKSVETENMFYGVIQELSEQLKSSGFFMPHKSYLVNYRFVKSFHPDCLYLVNGERIPISKGKRQEVAKLQLRMENRGM